jgi:hypothetical protein
VLRTILRSSDTYHRGLTPVRHNPTDTSIANSCTTLILIGLLMHDSQSCCGVTRAVQSSCSCASCLHVSTFLTQAQL